MERSRFRCGGWRWLSGLAILLGAMPAVAEIEWRDSTRDVWIDGRVDRNAQVFIHEDDVAVLSAALPWVVVFQIESLDLRRMDKDDLRISDDRAGATSREPSSPIDGIVEPVGESGTYVVVARDRQLVVAPHRGLIGEVTLPELWRHVPVWRSLAASYEPEAEVVETLRRFDREVEVTVYFGTWCGDSKRAVPRLLQTLRQVANPGIALRLVALARGMAEPLELIRENRLTNVPTVVISEGGVEIGRIVETPSGDSFESDLAAILSGTGPPDHPGRWERGASLARGRYTYTDAGGAVVGEERWELWAGEEEGLLLRSRVRRGAASIELWQRRDAAGKTEFVEVTRRSVDGHSRTRHWIEEGELHALTRGDTTGIVDQKLGLPDGVELLLPSAATAGSAHRLDEGAVWALRIPGLAGPASAELVTAETSAQGVEEIETAVGSFRARKICRRVGDEVAEWWLHPDLGIPVAGRSENGERVTLQELERTAESIGPGRAER